jgi:chaperonin GroEL
MSKFGHGYASPYFITDFDRAHAYLERCSILVTGQNVSSVEPLRPLLAKTVHMSRSLLLVAADFTDEVLVTLAVEKIRDGLRVCAVKASSMEQRQVLDDFAASVGTVVLPSLEQSGRMEDLGYAANVVVTKDYTVASADSIDV